MAKGSSHDSPKDIAPSLLLGEDAITNEKGRCPGVIRDNPDRDVVLFTITICSRGSGFYVADHGLEKVRIIVAENALGHRCDPLQAQPRVDTGFGKGCQCAIRIAVVLHKNEVPQFKESVTLAADLTLRSAAADPRSLIDDDFRAWSTRTGVTHAPEVVFC